MQFFLKILKAWIGMTYTAFPLFLLGKFKNLSYFLLVAHVTAMFTTLKALYIKKTYILLCEEMAYL